MRSLKTDNSPMITGMQLHHNYVRSHSGINEMTPTDRAGVIIKGVTNGR